MTTEIDAPTLKAWLSDGRELALLDVREPGQFGEGASLLRGAARLQPLRARPAGARCRTRPCGSCFATAGDGVAEPRGWHGPRRSATATSTSWPAASQGWKRAGYTLYAGVNVPSKTFGELDRA